MNIRNPIKGSTNWLNDPYTTSFHVTRNSTIFPLCILPSNRPRFWAWVFTSSQPSDLPLRFSFMHRSKTSATEFVFKISSPTHHKIDPTFQLVGICHDRTQILRTSSTSCAKIAAKHHCEQATLEEQSHQTGENRNKGTEGQS